MLTNQVVAERMTAAHHELLSRAVGFFTPQWLDAWRTTSDGYLDKGVWPELARQGYLGVSLPVDLGGQGLGVLGSLVLGEALAQLGDGGALLSMHVHNDVAGQWLASTRQAALREQYLPRLLDGTLVACQCDTDPSPRERAIATLDGDEVVVRGAKLFVINGAGADVCFVNVLLDGAPAIVLVDKDRPGVHITKVYDKLGTRCIDSARVEFADVRVPAGHTVARGGLGQLLHWNRVMSRMRFLIAVDAYLTHRQLLARIRDYAAVRELGGRPLAAWPVNTHALARARADLELMEAGIADILVRLDGGAAPVPEISELKWFCVERACALAALCCDLEGGAGYMWDSASLCAYAQLRGLRMAGGSQTTMLTIANHSLACRAELAGDLPAEDLDVTLDRAMPVGAGRGVAR
jgi:alkylation response protein AidB-like acyl-CoA dehydrogenase